MSQKRLLRQKFDRVCRTFVELNFDTRCAVGIRCRASVAPKSNLHQLGSAHEKYGVWTGPSELSSWKVRRLAKLCSSEWIVQHVLCVCFRRKERLKIVSGKTFDLLINCLIIVNSLRLRSIRRELISVRYYCSCWLIVRCFVWLCVQYFWMQLLF